ncbi:MAG TPA: DUF4013 domain-containing protein, partial [Myxococcota bacterium]|jgi:hypothetical protein
MGTTVPNPYATEIAMDLGEIIKAPLADKDWWKKCLVMGLMFLIPIAGPLNLLGYSKAVYRQRSSGETALPPAALAYIGDGFWILVAMLPMVGVMIVAEIVVVVLGSVLGHVNHHLGGIVAMIGMLLIGLLGLAFGVLYPAILYRHIVHGDRWASLNVSGVLAAVKSGPYLMLWVTVLVGGIIGGLGSVACGVGYFITFPLAYCIYGTALADFDKASRG